MGNQVMRRNVAVVLTFAMLLSVFAGFGFGGLQVRAEAVPYLNEDFSNAESFTLGSASNEWRTSNPEQVEVNLTEVSGKSGIEFNANEKISELSPAQAYLFAPALNPKANGERIIFDTKFYNTTGKQNSIVLKNSNNKTVLNFDFCKSSEGKSTVSYVNNADNLIKDTATQYTDNTWYRLIAILNCNTLDYDFYIYDDNDKLIQEYKGLKAIKGQWGATAPSDVASLQYIMNDSVGALTINYVKVFSDPDFSLPVQTEPDISAEPKPVEFIWSLYEHQDKTTASSGETLATSWTDKAVWLANAGSPYLAGQRYYCFTSNKGLWVETTPTLPETGKYRISMYIPHASGTTVGQMTISQAEGDPIVFSDIDTNKEAGSWVDIGSAEFTVTEPVIKFEAEGAAQQNFRVDTLKFTEDDGTLPSSEPSIEPSADTSAEPDQNQDFLNETFGSLTTGDYVINSSDTSKWRTSAANVTAEVVENPSETDKSLNIISAGKGESTIMSPAFINPAKGNRVIMDSKFMLADGQSNRFIYFNSNNTVALNFDFVKGSEVDQQFTLKYYSGSATELRGSKKYDNNTWYRMIVVLNTNQVTYDFYLFDDNDQLIEGFTGLKAYKGTKLTSETCNIKSLQVRMGSATKTYDSSILINYNKIFIDDQFELPEMTLPSPSPSPSPVVPSVSPSPVGSPTPTPFTSIIDIHVDQEGYEQYPEGESLNAKTGWGRSSLMTDGSRATSRYTEMEGAWAKFTPVFDKNLPGRYKVYYYNVYTTNDYKMDIDIKASGVIQKQQKAIPTGISLTAWTELGEYEFNGNGDEYVLLKATGGAFARTSAIRFELVETSPSEPKANDVTIAGSFAVGETIALSYQYLDYNNDKEAGSTYRLYYADSKTSSDWKEVPGLSGSCDSMNPVSMQLPAEVAGKYLKAGVVPKNNASEKPVGAEYFSNVVGPVAATQAAPVAKNVVIDGKPSVFAVLKGNYEYFDESFDLEEGSLYQWYYADSADAGEWTKAPDGSGTATAESGAEYLIPGELQGKYIKLGITPKNNSATFNTGTEVFSAAVGPVDVSTEKGAVTAATYGGQAVLAQGWQGAAIGGAMEVSSYVYTHSLGIAENPSQVKYQWYIGTSQNGSYTKIDGATAKSYTPSESDAGKYIRVGITPTSINGAVGNEFLANPMLVRYNLKFYDEFDYIAEDGYAETFKEKWISDQGLRVLGQPEVRMMRIPENVEVKDGKLFIHNRHEKNPNYDIDHTWTTGNVYTKERFTYGYYESTFKWVHSSGLNQSFWMMSPNITTVPEDMRKNHIELDFCEGHYPRQIATNIMRYSGTGTTVISNSIKHNDVVPEPQTLADDFIKIGGIYKPNDPNYAWDDPVHNGDNFQVFFNDKRLRSTPSMPDEPNPGNIYLTCAIYPGNFAGPLTMNPDGTYAADGTALEYEYARFYEFLDTSASELAGLIEQVDSQYGDLEAGTEFGQCPATYLNGLMSAKAEAEQVVNNPASTQEERKAQISKLRGAMNSVNANVVHKGTLQPGKTYDLSKSYFTKDIEASIGADNSTSTVIMPDIYSRTIVMKKYLSLGNNKTAAATLTIPANTQIEGSYRIPSVISYTNDNYDIVYAVSASGLSFTNHLGKLELTVTSNAKAGIVSEGILNEIAVKINNDNQAAAQAAIGENREVYYNGGSFVSIYTKALSDYVLFKEKGSVTPEPSPTPTPDNGGNGGNNNNGGYYPGVIIPGTGSNTVNFNDISGHWAQSQIKALAKDGIIKGKADQIFAPEDRITRAEFAALIRRALDFNLISYDGQFGDIAGGEWYAEEIAAIADSGLITGDTDGNFRPNDPITREEMAKIIVNAYTLKYGAINETSTAFGDAGSISGWAVTYVNRAVSAGLMNGQGNNLFAPMADSTRAESAAVVYRLLNQ